MLINPLQAVVTEENMNKTDVNKDKVIGEIITYLINQYSEYLSDIEINKSIVENIVRESLSGVF